MTGLMKGLQPYSPHWKNHGTGGGTSFTLDVSSTTNATILIVGGVIQLAGTDYTVSGTTVTTTTSVTSGVEVISAVLYDLGSVTTPAAGSVNFDSLGFTSQSQGDLLVRGASSWARLPAGTSGQFLKTQGTGANPTWAEAGGGAWSFISSTDISSAASFDFTAVDASAYDGYMMYLMNVVPVTDATYLWLRTSTDGGSNYDSGGANYGNAMVGVDGSGSIHDQFSATQISLNGDSASDNARIGSASGEDGVSGFVMVHSPHLAKETNVTWQINFTNANGDASGGFFTGAGARQSSADVDAFQVLFSAGNIESGTITVLGLKNS